jgi:hypothetical protein
MQCGLFICSTLNCGEKGTLLSVLKLGCCMEEWCISTAEMNDLLSLNSPKKLNSFVHTHTLLIACPANECCWFFLPHCHWLPLSLLTLPLSHCRRAHTVTVLFILTCVLVYVTLLEETPQDTTYNTKRSAIRLHTHTHTHTHTMSLFYNHAARWHTLSHDCLCERNHFHLEQPVTFSPAGLSAQSFRFLLYF